MIGMLGFGAMGIKTRNIKFLAIIVCLLIFRPVPVLAQSNRTELTITTYYPSPHGVYRNLRLFPSSEPADTTSRQPGTMFFNQTDGNVYIFINESRGWQPIGVVPLVNSAHTQAECTAMGGEVVDSDVVLKQCRFKGPTCPSGWVQYKYFSSTDAEPLYLGYTYQCTAPAKAWSGDMKCCGDSCSDVPACLSGVECLFATRRTAIGCY